MHALNRRTFLGSAAAGAMFLGARGSRAETPAAKRGGHFKLGTGSGATTDSLDPATYVTFFMDHLGHSLHGYLTEVNAAGELVGELTESWEPSPDAKIWTFKLRSGVEFHNGKSLDADDVIRSLNHHRGQNSKSAAKSLLSSVADIEKDGDGIVRITLSEGNADFPYVLDDYHLAILPAKGDTVDLSGVGAGGYVLEQADFGVKATGSRFKNYWKPNAAWFDSIEVIAIHDVTARSSALISGEIHAMDKCDIKTIGLLESNPDIEVMSVAGTQHYTMPMLVDVPPFDDVNVRLALKYGVDRKAILDSILGGHGQIGNDHPIAPQMRFAARDLPQRPYDPDQAKFYWTKSGLGNTALQLSAAEAAFTGALDTAQLYQSSLKKAGITIDVVREANDAYWDNVWMKKPWCMGFWSGRATADWMLSQVYLSTAKWNETHWKNASFDKMLIEARSELDETRRTEMYRTLQAMVSDEGGVVIPVFANYVFAASRKIGHGKIGSSWNVDGYRSTERWWFQGV